MTLVDKRARRIRTAAAFFGSLAILLAILDPPGCPEPDRTAAIIAPDASDSAPDDELVPAGTCPAAVAGDASDEYAQLDGNVPLGSSTTRSVLRVAPKTSPPAHG